MTTTLITGTNKDLGYKTARRLVAAGQGELGLDLSYFDLKNPGG